MKRKREAKGNGNLALEDGGVAQLGEHLPCTQGVRSSILLISTTRGKMKRGKRQEKTLASNIRSLKGVGKESYLQKRLDKYLASSI